MSFTNELKSHSVQIAYCVDCNGNLRIFVEHWHGSENPNSTNMTISLNVNNVITTQTQPPAFGLINVPFASLPGCVTPVTSVGGCPGSMNTYNDWVVYDYTNLPAGVPIAFTIISGNNVFTQDGCGMFPLTVNFVIPLATNNGAPVTVCSGQQTPIINVPPGTNWTNTNPSIGLPASGTGPINPFIATGPATGVITFTNGCGISNTTLTVIPSLVSTFTTNAGNGVCVGTPVSFSNTSPVSTGWQWNFGNGNTSTLQNPTYVYPLPGTYIASLTVTNGTNSCPGTSTQVVVIDPMPIPAFTLTPTCDNTPTVSIINSSSIQSGTIGYQWTMNGATPNTSSVSAPVITYSAAGNYSVALTLTSNKGCTSSLTKTVQIFPKPTISFTANPVCKGFTSTFVNTSTVALPNTITNWFWDFNNDNVTDNTTLSPTNTFTNDGVYPVELKALTNNGCRDSLLLNIIVHATPTVAFSAANNCPNTAIILGNTSAINAPSTLSLFAWNFGFSSTPATSSLSLPTNVTYGVPGVKTITLTLTSNNNCTATATQTVLIYTAPSSTFNANPVCSGAITSFTDLSTPTGSITNWDWDFDNNLSIDATTQNPTNLYPASGNHTVTLITTSSNGCKDTLQKTVVVYGRSVINFGPTSVCFNTPTIFTNSTSITVNPNTSAVTSYSWNFGAPGGGSSTLQNPSYTYTTPANATTNTTYSATLFATTANGCKDSLTLPVTVYSLPTPNFTADSVCFGSLTTLNDASNLNGNPLFIYSWDFNADNVSDLSNNALSSTHTFTNWGNNSVIYTVFTSPNGGLLTCSDKITKNVWVHPIPVSQFNFTNKCIDAQPNLMNGSPSNISIGSIANYAWNYGNGNVNLINPLAPSSYSYNLPGNYVVTLTVTSLAGCSNTSSQTVEVWERPYANFSYSKLCEGKQTIIKGNQLPPSAPIATYQWDFNNTLANIEATGAEVTYTFNTGGLTPINLVVTSIKGCTNTIPGNLYINYNPKPNFYAPKRAGCSDLCISILDSTEILTAPAKLSAWEWSFGNNSFNNTNLPNTQYTCYTNSSNSSTLDYSLKLIVRTDSGCVDSIVKSNYIRVFPKPLADFEWKGDDGDLLTPVIVFQNTSIGYNKFSWYYNDGVNVTDSVNQNPKHYYKTDVARNFNVFLAVRNQYGCKDTTSKYVEIGPEYTFYIPNTFTPNDDGVNEMFRGYGIGFKAYKMWIYDRWGEKLYYTEDINKGWDGSVKGKVVQDKMDVYTYKAIVTDLWNKDHEYVGHVTILE